MEALNALTAPVPDTLAPTDTILPFNESIADFNSRTSSVPFTLAFAITILPDRFVMAACNAATSAVPSTFAETEAELSLTPLTFAVASTTTCWPSAPFVSVILAVASTFTSCPSSPCVSVILATASNIDTLAGGFTDVIFASTKIFFFSGVF